MNRTVKTMIYCALFAALTAVCSQLAIPIQPVPINLALLSVYIAGGLLGGGMGAASQAVFLLIGVVGVPVFAGFRGGVQALVGPTGGYLIGYVAAAFVTGVIVKRLGAKPLKIALACAVGMAACYALGTAWYCVQSGTPALAALSTCVFPFLPGDAVKIAAAALLVPRLKRVIKL